MKTIFGLLGLLGLFGLCILPSRAAKPDLSCLLDHTKYFNVTLHKCCSRCPPGTYELNVCTETKDTGCSPCTRGSVQEYWSYRLWCRSCDPCDGDHEFVITPCTTAVETVCGCKPGYTMTPVKGGYRGRQCGMLSLSKKIHIRSWVCWVFFHKY
ncbi:protein ORF150D [Cyprinid herpesvirus 1]|uniref:Protein ORF150D n=1 Tax=Cyprinid herpesvirus 1 TaxID=317858 RepID=K7PBM9_9VIRU|nr:protein ORF150D [Cyprinid herpesvirus 1]AFJ20441.1 protein ORF150D [Cyprinid herpesvirus 1]